MTELPGVLPIDSVEQVTLPAIRPSAAWYVLGVTVIVGGLLAAFLILTAGAFGYLREIEELPRVELPGPEQVELPAGQLTVFHEPGGGLVYPGDALGLVVTGTDGDALEVASRGEADQYVSAERAGVAVAEVVIPASGRYEVRVTSDAEGAVAIGARPREHLTAYGIAAVAVTLLAVAVGVVTLVVVRRRRARSLQRRFEWQRSRQDTIAPLGQPENASGPMVGGR